MTEPLEIYKCMVCGIVVEVQDGGAGEPVCCGRPMVLMKARTAGEGADMHVPVVQQAGGQITVTVGSAPHPMEAKHFIQWIEVLADGRACRQFLRPGDEPRACFAIESPSVTVRQFCNLHGLWRA